MQANLDKISIPEGFVLYDWQKDFLNNHDKDRVLLCAEAGTGKTIAGICWMKLRSKVKTLVIAPRSTVKKWREELDKWGVKADVISTDYIKKTDLRNYGALVVDECQNFCSALFDKTRSYRSTILYNHIRQHPNVHVFLASATPIRSKPENLHTLLCYLGVYWDRKKFRDEFLHLTNKFGRIHYEPNSDWRKKIRPYLEKHAHIVLMSDCVDVPVHEYKVINIKWTKKQENELKKQQYEEPAKEWHTRHRLEQGDNKWKEVQKILDGNRKVVLVCFYLDQIEDYRKRIGDNRQVFVLTGSTKDQGQVVTDANESGDCVLLIQAGLGQGFDLDKFSVQIFASMSFAFVHLIQMEARINRIHNLHPNQYIYLLGGKNDESVYKQLKKGFDFHPPAYYNDSNGRTTGITEDIKKGRSEGNPESVGVDEEVPF